MERQGVGMGVDPCGGGPRGGGTVANAGVCQSAPGHH